MKSNNLLFKALNRIRRNILNTKWQKVDYILKSNDFNDNFLNKYKDVKEIEHQVGRYLNMKEIVFEIKENQLDGDLIEFGTWQGLGLILFENLFKNENMKFIGIDSFEGLPIDSTVWRKGMFNNTSEQIALDNFKKYCPKGIKQIHLIKGWFSDKHVSEKLYKLTSNVVLIHFDADLGMSTTQALDIIYPYLINRKKHIYFLFDDWGCHPDEVPDAFLNWVATNCRSLNFKLIKLSSTRFTRYYRLDFQY